MRVNARLSHPPVTPRPSGCPVKQTIRVGLACVWLTQIWLPSAATAYVIIDGLLSVDHRFGVYLSGAENSGDWAGVGYEFLGLPSTIGFLAGNQLDDSAVGAALPGSWVHEVEGVPGAGRWHGQGSIWDLDLPVRVIDVFPFIDHAEPSPFLEATEFRVWGSNDRASWVAADFTAAWSLGYRADAVYDDFTSRWEWADEYRYVGIVSGNPETGYLSDEAEIDAVGAPVPEPKTLLLIGAGLIAFAAGYKRRGQSVPLHPIPPLE